MSSRLLMPASGSGASLSRALAPYRLSADGVDTVSRTAMSWDRLKAGAAFFPEAAAFLAARRADLPAEVVFSALTSLRRSPVCSRRSGEIHTA